MEFDFKGLNVKFWNNVFYFVLDWKVEGGMVLLIDVRDYLSDWLDVFIKEFVDIKVKFLDG